MAIQGKTAVGVCFLWLGFFCSNVANAQQKEGSNWLFGKGASISFASGNPVSDTSSKQASINGCGTISDAQGNLLFYTNGCTVWNRNHQVMPHGTGLLEVDSLNKSVLIQKKPGSEILYYIFYANNPVRGVLGTGRFYYSVVDMSQNNGLGDVIPIMKNIMLLPRVARMVAAAQHANNRDFWIITHGYPTSMGTWPVGVPGTYDSTYYSFLLSENGVNTESVKTILPSPFDRIDPLMKGGSLRTSPNSELLVWAMSPTPFAVLKIDRSLGKLERKFLGTAAIGLDGKLCFSGDSKFLFVASGGTTLWSYDVSKTSQDDFFYSGKFILQERYGLPVFDLRLKITDIQLGIDGKLYVNPYEGATFLSRINNPCKRFGPDIGWEPYAVDLKGRKCGLEFPVHNQTLFVNAGKLQAQAAKDTICAGDSVEILAYGAGAEQFQWFKNQETVSFSSSGKIKVAPGQTTTYRVKGTGVCANKDTSVKVVVLPRPVVSLGADRQLCEGSSISLSINPQPQVRYNWSSDIFPGISTTSGASVNLTAPACDSLCPGFVRIRATNAGCTVKDSIRISIFGKPKQKPTLSPFPDTSFCFGGSATLRASGFTQFQTLWSTGDSTRNIVVNNSGIYTARFKNAQGCISDSSQSVMVTVHPLPITQTLANNKKDTTLCFPASINLGINPESNVSYLWQGPSIDSLSNAQISNPAFNFANTDTAVVTFNFTLSTLHALTGCQNKDSLTLKLVPFLRPYAGPDHNFCNENQKTIGQKGISGFQYQWNPENGLQNPQLAQSPTNLINSSFENIWSQIFIRTVSLLGCQASDTVQVQVFPAVPKPVLSGPQFVCPGVQNVPYQLNMNPTISTFDFLTFTFDLSGGDSTGRFLVNWNAENPNATAKIKLGNVFGCKPDSFILPVNVTRNLRPQTLLSPGLNDSLCLANAQSISYRIQPFNPISRYDWAVHPPTSSSTSPTFDSLLLNFNLSGIYTLTLSESDTTPLAECFGKTDFKVRIWPQPMAKAILGKDSLCHQASSTFEIQNQKLESVYNWTSEKGIIENTQPNGGKVNYTADFELQSDFTSIQLSNTETSDKGCLGPENEKIVVVESLPKPVILSPQDNLEWKSLEGQTYTASGRPGSSFQWEAENGNIAGGQGTKEVTINWLPNQLRYRLKVQEITRIGCLGESGMLSIPYDSALFVPNLITPNGDRKNDALFIQNLHFYPDNELILFDRWGRKVFQASPYTQNWPTEKIQNGLFFFNLQAGAQLIKGWVMVAE